MSSTKAEPVSMERISNALKSIDTKKENLRRAYEYVQMHSSALASPTIQWSELEDYFNSVQKSLEERFEELQSKEKPSKELEKGDTQSLPVNESNELETVTIHPELKSLCAKMDGIGLRSYIMNHRKDLQRIRKEVAVALRSASDPSKLVLDAIQGFYSSDSKRDKGSEVTAVRKTCLLLLEELIVISPQIKPQVKQEAKKLSVDWKEKISPGDENLLETSAFLQLLATYGLASEFNIDEVLEILVSVSRRKQAVNLSRALLGSTDKIPDLIRELSSKGRQLDAIKFAYAFELVDKFPPVPLLKAFLKESKKVAQEVRKKGNNSTRAQNEATDKEIASLRTAVKCIEEHQLESQFPRENLDNRIEQLEKQKADRKRPAMAPAKMPSPKPQQQQQTGNKRPRPAAPPNTGAATIRPVALNSQMYPQSMGFLPDRIQPYSSAHYGLVGPTTVSNYPNAAAGPSGVGGTHLNFGVNLNPSMPPHFYSSQPHLTSDLHDRSMFFGGNGLPPSYGQSSFY